MASVAPAATFPVQPPQANLAWVEIRPDGQWYLTQYAHQWLTRFFAAVQGSGGVIDRLLDMMAQPAGLPGALADIEALQAEVAASRFSRAAIIAQAVEEAAYLIPNVSLERLGGAPVERPAFQGWVEIPRKTVLTVPPAAEVVAGALIYVENETGGPVVAFFDGTDWRRVTDRNVVS